MRTWESLQDFRSSNNLEELETETDVFADVRDRSIGREVNFWALIRKRDSLRGLFLIFTNFHFSKPKILIQSSF